jgi:microcystin-dependent protein
MAAEQTGRFDLFTWESDSDEFSRSQMDTSHKNIETFGAVFRQDVDSQKGDANTWVRTFFYAEDTEILWFSDGNFPNAEWRKLTDFGSAGSMVAVSPTTPTANQGASDQAARIDHRHATPPWGTTTVAVGTSAVAGTLDQFARIDHVHVLGTNSVTAGTIASSAINNENAFTAGVVKTAAIGLNAVTKEKIATDQQIPTGVIMPYVGATAPDGWLMCDGLPRLKSAYPALWALLSTQNYGSDATNFNTPNLLDRMPRGAGDPTDTLGAIDGSNTVTIQTTHMPQHQHPLGNLAVTAHANHSHSVTGSTVTQNISLNHDHSLSNHIHGGLVNNPAIVSTGGNYPFPLFMVPQTRFSGPYVTDEGTGFAGGSYTYGGANLFDRNITTYGPNVDATSARNLDHVHGVSGGTGQINVGSNELTHQFTGSLGNTGGGNPITVLPKTQTVNYIIKT